jgi:hypothetical protein
LERAVIPANWTSSPADVWRTGARVKVAGLTQKGDYG